MKDYSSNSEVKKILSNYLDIDNPKVDDLINDLMQKGNLTKQDASMLGNDFYLEYLTPEKKELYERKLIREVAIELTEKDFNEQIEKQKQEIKGEDFKNKVSTAEIVVIPYEDFATEINKSRANQKNDNISQILSEELKHIIVFQIYDSAQLFKFPFDAYTEKFLSRISEQIQLVNTETLYLRLFLLIDFIKKYNPTQSKNIDDEITHFSSEKLNAILLIISEDKLTYRMEPFLKDFIEVLKRYYKVKGKENIYNSNELMAKLALEFYSILESKTNADLLFSENTLQRYACKVIVYTLSDYNQFFLSNQKNSLCNRIFKYFFRIFKRVK